MGCSSWIELVGDQPGLADQHRQHPVLAQPHELDLAHRIGPRRRGGHHAGVLREGVEEIGGAGEQAGDVGRVGGEGGDAVALGGAGRAHLEQGVDVEPVGLGGGDAPGGGVRLLQQAERLEVAHDRAHRGRRALQAVARVERLRGHRLAGLDVVLDQGAQDVALDRLSSSPDGCAMGRARYGRAARLAPAGSREVPRRGGGERGEAPLRELAPARLGGGAVAGRLGQQGLEVALLLGEGEGQGGRGPRRRRGRGPGAGGCGPRPRRRARRPGAPARRAGRRAPRRASGPTRGRPGPPRGAPPARRARPGWRARPAARRPSRWPPPRRGGGGRRRGGPRGGSSPPGR